GVLAICAQWRAGMPERRDVVVDFLFRRDLDQLHRAFAPVADRLRPQARAALETGFEVLIGEEILLPLHQTEAMRIEVGEGADLQILRVMQRTPQFFAAAVEYPEPVGVM